MRLFRPAFFIVSIVFIDTYNFISTLSCLIALRIYTD